MKMAILRRKSANKFLYQSFKLVDTPLGNKSVNNSNPLRKQIKWNNLLEEIREFKKKDYENEYIIINKLPDDDELVEYWHIFQGYDTPCLVCNFNDVDHHSYMITRKKNLKVQKILKQQDNRKPIISKNNKSNKPHNLGYVMNIIYNDVGIFLSKRINKHKKIYNLWQVPGGKIEENEYSIEAVIRETEEKIGLIIKNDIPKLIFNDSGFNCDIYITKVNMNTTLRNTELDKQKNLEISRMIAQAQWEEHKPQDAYFAEAEVFERKINVMIDTGAVKYIIIKSFLDSVHKDIEVSTNIQIISIIEARIAPLGKMLKVSIKIGKFEIIVTESFRYNVLLGNDWITIQAKAIIDTSKQIMIIKQNNETDIVPIMYFSKINPKVFILIDFVEEKYDDLEIEEIYKNLNTI
ncbi:5885_t:CDS:2 [Funneliformis mosseae]|uniref:5885_t:CDS:1 n=1 Tax=Funneliformis mosseae TaxID=27381 RepID=A0A9N8YIR8_FUNMO|nr:5885_t:CDS:2 [Funneliformis mosseae]